MGGHLEVGPFSAPVESSSGDTGRSSSFVKEPWAGPAYPITAQVCPEGSATSGCQCGNRRVRSRAGRAGFRGVGPVGAAAALPSASEDGSRSTSPSVTETVCPLEHVGNMVPEVHWGPLCSCAGVLIGFSQPPALAQTLAQGPHFGGVL